MAILLIAMSMISWLFTWRLIFPGSFEDNLGIIKSSNEREFVHAYRALFNIHSTQIVLPWREFLSGTIKLIKEKIMKLVAFNNFI